jgi:CheY-like chemotaxis protein
LAPRSDQTTLNIFVADEQLEMRRLIRTALQGLRRAEYTEYKEFEALKADLAFAWLDLILVDMELPGGDICELIRAIRYNEYGMNPFVPIIAMTWATDRNSIRNIIDTGVDSVLIKPLSSGAIIKYVDMLTNARKSFVVTSSYIGPDRRANSKRVNTVPLMEVPNTLQKKRNGEAVNIAELNTWIASELEVCRDERLRSCAVEICRLLGLILSDYDEGKVGTSTFDGLARIKEIATDLSERTRKGDYNHIAGLCDSLVKVSRALVKNRMDPVNKDLKLIKPLCDAILVGIDDESANSDFAVEVASSVSEVRAAG